MFGSLPSPAADVQPCRSCQYGSQRLVTADFSAEILYNDRNTWGESRAAKVGINMWTFGWLCWAGRGVPALPFARKQQCLREGCPSVQCNQNISLQLRKFVVFCFWFCFCFLILLFSSEVSTGQYSQSTQGYQWPALSPCTDTSTGAVPSVVVNKITVTDADC